MTTPAATARPRIPEAVHRRRWAILGVLMLSLLIVVLDNSILNVAMKTIATPAPDRTGRHPERAGVGDQLLHPRLRRAALHRRPARRPARPQEGAARRPRRLRHRLGARRLRPARPANSSRFRALMGFGARLRDARHPRRPDERLRARRAAQGHRHLGGRRRPRHRHRPDHRRRAARALLVGLGLPGQRADRDRRAGRDGCCWCPTPATRSPGRIDPLGVLLSVVGLVLLVYGIIKGGQLADFTDPRCCRPWAPGSPYSSRFVLHEKRSDHPSHRRRATSATRPSPPPSPPSRWSSSR